MNEEKKTTLTKAELEERVKQFRQTLKEASAAEEEAKRKQAEKTQTPAPQPKAEPAPAPQPKPAPVQKSQTKSAQAQQPAPVQQPAQQSKPKKKHTGLKILLGIILLLAVLWFLLTQVFFGVVKADDAGMEDTIKEGTYVVFSRLDKTPEIDDLIVLKDKEGHKHIRYVAALKGHIVDYDVYDQRVFIDAQPAARDFAISEDNSVDFPHTMGGSEVFVLCENREDADNEGIYPKKSILGKVLLTL